jgi:hypothetical protein
MVAYGCKLVPLNGLSLMAMCDCEPDLPGYLVFIADFPSPGSGLLFDICVLLIS